jgi:MFS family permease
VRSYLRSLDPGLERGVWTLLSGSFANAFGNGVVFPFLLIYLHNVRGIALGTAGLVLAALGVAGIVVNPLVGTLLDHLGPRRILVGSMVLAICGYGGFAFVRTVPEAFAAAIAAGAGNASFWPSHSSLVAGLTSREQRSSAYAMQRVLNNLGIGVGGLVGGLIATTAHPGTYQLLFGVDALTFLVYLGVLSSVPSPPRVVHEPDAPRASYRRVLRHRTFVAYSALIALVVGLGFSFLGDIFPAYAKNHAHVDERGIGIAFLANTLVIVVFQLPVAKWLEGRRRMGAYAVEGVIWATAWIGVLLGGLWLTGSAATAVFTAALGIFGFGECFHGTVQNALVADLAGPGLLGRYMAASGFAFQLGMVAGRSFGGFALALFPNALWLGAAGVALAGSAAALWLDRFLPESVRRTPRRAGAAGVGTAAAG